MLTLGVSIQYQHNAMHYWDTILNPATIPTPDHVKRNLVYHNLLIVEPIFFMIRI
jgi:hypothetical protein